MLIAEGNQIRYCLTIVFSLGTLMFFALYQSRLIPRWLSGWGFIGVVLNWAQTCCHVGLHIVRGCEFGPIGPAAIQEMVFAVWLIVKGFNPSRLAALSANTGIKRSVTAQSWGSYPPAECHPE